MIYLVSGQTELYNNDLYKLISVEESINILNSCDVLQYDSETTGKDAHINKLVCIQFGNKEKDFQIVIDTTTVNVLFYKNILENKFIVGQNLKFDLQFLYNYNIIPKYVYDTMIVEQLLYLGYPYISLSPESYKEYNYDYPYLINDKNNYYELSYSLKAIAWKYLNIDIDKTVRGEIIWRGLDARTIMYAAGDVMYLEDIMTKQIKVCRDKNCIVGAKLECDFVPVIAYLEWCGIKLDEDKWKAKMLKDKTNLIERKQALDNFILQDNKLKKYTKFELQGDLFTGFQETPECIINWDSSRQVVSLAKDLGFDTTVKDKKSGEDKDSVLEKVIKSQKGINDTFLKLYFDYKESSKVVSTYGQGHLDVINPNTGRIHTTYKQLGAASGRMSCGSRNTNDDLAKLKKIPASRCTYPNMQQLPHDKETRACFVSEKNNLFCSCDYSALESRLGADIYNEKSMIDEFLYKSGDIHSLVAAACFPELKGLTTEQIKKEHSDLRTRAKPIGFSQQFGGSAMAIAQSLGCSLEEAERIANAYNKGFPGIANFKKVGSKFVRENGYVLMCKYTGHKMYWWDHNKWLNRQKSFTSDFWDEYKLNHKGKGTLVEKEVKEHFQAASKWDRMALNAPTQNTGICILKMAMIDFFKYIITNNLFNEVKIVALVHDEANIEYPETMPEIGDKLKDCMEKAALQLCKSLPIPAEVSIGKFWIH